MSKKDLAVIGGFCTIVGALTAASRKRRWEEIHTAVAVLGGLITIAGAAS